VRKGDNINTIREKAFRSIFSVFNLLRNILILPFQEWWKRYGVTEKEWFV
jgi:hypothetical protein